MEKALSTGFQRPRRKNANGSSCPRADLLVVTAILTSHSSASVAKMTSRNNKQFQQRMMFRKEFRKLLRGLLAENQLKRR
jgi:hypothetical protein